MEKKTREILIYILTREKDKQFWLHHKFNKNCPYCKKTDEFLSQLKE